LKKILITGAGGFIGKSLLSKLSKTQNELVTFSKHKHYFDFNLTEIIGDINNEKIIKKLVSDVDIIIHLAAYLDVKQSFIELEKVYHTNLDGTFNLLKHVKDLEKKPHFVFMSSSVVYGNTTKIPIKETQMLNPTNPYGMSKASSELLCLGISNSYGIPLTILRPFSVYGYLAPKHQVIPRIVSQLENKTLIVDNPHEIRDFVHVDDVVESITKSIKHNPKFPKIYNVGSGKPVSILSLTKTIIRLSKNKPKLIFGNKIFNRKKSLADISSIQKDLNWKPKIDLDDGISEFLSNMHEKQHEK
jgi:nucleoside-diphosphate-sugar epimerase